MKITIGEFIERINVAILTLHPRTDEALTLIGEHAKKLAKGYIGHYQPGWPPLAASTVAHKGADTPLLETGELRDSIEFQVDRSIREVAVGSHERKAVWHEMGTHRIPPRPFLGPAMTHSEPFAAEVLGKAIVQTLLGNR